LIYRKEVRSVVSALCTLLFLLTDKLPVMNCLNVLPFGSYLRPIEKMEKGGRTKDFDAHESLKALRNELLAIRAKSDREVSAMLIEADEALRQAIKEIKIYNNLAKRTTFEIPRDPAKTFEIPKQMEKGGQTKGKPALYDLEQELSKQHDSLPWYEAYLGVEKLKKATERVPSAYRTKKATNQAFKAMQEVESALARDFEFTMADLRDAHFDTSTADFEKRLKRLGLGK